jgi:hypothetical protein|tara:strand:- start:43 stop:603 length:561 start_codon:yes stop_codon:yes gene_type:complete
MAIDFTFTGRDKTTTPTVANTMSATYGGLGSKMAPSYNNTPTATYGGFSAGQRFGDLQTALADTGYQRSDVQRSRAMSIDDLIRQFADQRRRIPGQFNQRGMLDSGQYQRGMGRSFADQVRQQGRLEMAAQAALNSLAQRQFAAEQQYAVGRLQDALGSATSRAQTASQVPGVGDRVAQLLSGGQI